MNLIDFSREFDILYNNINSNEAPGVTEYEKSVFLTQAQEALILDIVQGNKIEGVEDTELLKEQLSKLTAEKYLSKSTSSIPTISSSSILYELPENLLHILYEHILKKVDGCPDLIIQVLPTTHDKILKLLRNPFSGPSKQALRLNVGHNLIEVITDKNINTSDKYFIRYIRCPRPIVLEDSELPVVGYSTPQECELHESLHRNILSRAVILAKQVWLN